METITNLGSLNGLDIIALLIFVAVWQGISWWIEHPTAKHPSVTVLMSEYRRKWMLVMITRQPRIFDAQMMTSLRQGTSFFASTSLLAMGGLLALIGNVDPLQNVTMQIGHLETPAMELQTKLLLVLVLLGNAFLKFVWANRVFGYCSVMMGAVPNDPADPQAVPLARKAAELNIRAAMNFNRGLRSMYFALGAVAWIAGAWALLAACLAIGFLVWSREFTSIPREIILNDIPDTKV
ncbi:Uncharacterized membrane protein [Octadecabacter temperatus]|jgi:uncharacterized membrane protein|uniref:Uncharacterized protein n=1 Tax=Octadecabacter temperatus TaxID=1458307 RepID=A0A0K0Y8H4_9RHOB|nr:DUF599 domain-containing protein [Octadecabacter temperatus]AKS47263.1 hypothetical protein OSB_27390 [Octadecabacter temperatus]SIO44670.1 Uncharacterized membrane protein [Octadecabacter temperatus]